MYQDHVVSVQEVELQSLDCYAEESPWLHIKILEYGLGT